MRSRVHCWNAHARHGAAGAGALRVLTPGTLAQFSFFELMYAQGTVLPELKHRDFSLLYCASGGGPDGKPLGAMVNWRKRTWVDLQVWDCGGPCERTLMAMRIK